MGRLRHGRNLCPHAANPPRAPWLDLSAVSSALSQKRWKHTRAACFCAGPGRARQDAEMNLAFAIDRLEKLNLHLVAATVAPCPVGRGWDRILLTRIGEVWVAMPPLTGMATNCRNRRFAAVQFVERRRSTARHFRPVPLNALRTLPWKRQPESSWSDFYGLVRNLAL